MMKFEGNYTYTLKNTKTDEVKTVIATNKNEACALVGYKASQTKIVEKEANYKELTVKVNLTNAELIAILAKRDPNAEVDLLVDYSLWNTSAEYGFEEEDGVCYVEDDNQLVVSAGQFEC